jgi:hypothetical protein
VMRKSTEAAKAPKFQFLQKVSDHCCGNQILERIGPDPAQAPGFFFFEILSAYPSSKDPLSMASYFFPKKDHHDDQSGKMKEYIKEHRYFPQPQYVPEDNSGVLNC